MTEREPVPSPIELTPDQEPDATWQREMLGQVLDASPVDVHDVGWGDGTRYLLRGAADHATELRIYPVAGVVQVTSQDARITLFRQSPPSLAADRVHFAQVTATMQLDAILTRRGRLHLTITPLPEPAATTDDEPPPARGTIAKQQATQPVEIAPNSPIPSAESTEIAPGVATHLVARSGRAAGDVELPSETEESTEQHQPQPTPPIEQPERTSARLALAGRLGRLPAFRTTSGGKLIASFPLAVKDESGATTWHTVRVFGERAEKLREGLVKGQHLEVIGYLHQHERTTRDGRPRLVEEIYATVVTPR